MSSLGNRRLDKSNIRKVVFRASDNMQTKEQHFYIIFELQGYDATASSSWNARFSTKTSAWFGFFTVRLYVPAAST